MSKSKKNILSKPALRRKKPIKKIKKTSNINVLNKELLIKLYKEMLLIRRFEEKAGQLYGMGSIGGFVTYTLVKKRWLSVCNQFLMKEIVL